MNNLHIVVQSVLTLLMVYLAVNLLLSPSLFKANLISPTSEVEVCQGGTFKYKSSIDILRTPATLIRTETWYDTQKKFNVVPTTVGDSLVYNWREGFEGSIVRERDITVPSQLAPGNYEYIVNFSSYGLNRPSSFWIPVKIKEC